MRQRTTQRLTGIAMGAFGAAVAFILAALLIIGGK